jgi:hypothetical protein
MFSISRTLFNESELEFLDAIGEDGIVKILKLSTPKREILPPPKEESVAKPVEKQTAGDLGLSAEEAVLTALGQKYQVESVARVKHSGDIMIIHRGVRMLVEVKNYSTNVPKVEVAKFEQDLERSPAALGLFLSIRSAISGVGSFQFSDGPKRAILVRCPDLRLACTYADLLFASHAVRESSLLELDGVQRLAEKSRESLVRLYDAKQSLTDADRAIQRTRELISAAEVEAKFYLDKLTSRVASLVDPQFVPAEEGPATLSSIIQKQFPTSLLVTKAGMLDAFLSKICNGSTFTVASEKSKLMIRFESYSLIIKPGKTVTSIETRIGNTSQLVRAHKIGDFSEIKVI